MRVPSVNSNICNRNGKLPSLFASVGAPAGKAQPGHNVMRPIGDKAEPGCWSRELSPLNNNNRGNNNNNRRRGRGNRQQGGNGGQQLNRIDSRARGNAPQLLEKYRKLAQDAHLNGDRVTAEYYLQFADHYFRVIADGRQRVEEQRLRREDRWEGGDEQADDAGDFSVDNNDFPSFDQPSYNRAPQREERPRRDRDEESRGDTEEASDGAEGEASANPYEPPENPFVRGDNPGSGRGLRPRRDDRRPRRDDQPQGERDSRPRRDDQPQGERDSRPRRDDTAPQGERDSRPRRNDRHAEDDAPAGLNPSLLPPAIGASRSAPAEEDTAADAKPKRGRPRKRPAADESGEALETVG